MKLGFDVYTDPGPGVFLMRLREHLEQRDAFSADKPDVWIQTAYQQLPEAVARRREEGKTRVLVRMGGCACSRYHAVGNLPLPLLDDIQSRKVNAERNALIYHNLRAADGIVFQSEFARQLTHRFVTKTPPGFVIYNGVNLQDFEPFGPVDVALSGKLNILAAHTFRPWHRLHDVFRVYAEVRKKLAGTGSHLHVVGEDDGLSFAHARAVATGLGLKEPDDYTFWGTLDPYQHALVYRSCDVALDLAYWEASPNALIEVIATGVPVVGVNSGAVPEIIGDAGLTVNERVPLAYHSHHDFKAMPKAPAAQYAMRLLDLFLERDQYHQRAMERAKDIFDMAKVCDRYLAAAEITLEGKRAKTAAGRK